MFSNGIEHLCEVQIVRAYNKSYTQELLVSFVIL